MISLISVAVVGGAVVAGVKTVEKVQEQRVGVLGLSGPGLGRFFPRSKQAWLQSTAEREAPRGLQALKESAAAALVEVDSEYQRFMAYRVDPIFGRKRTSQLSDLSTGEEILVISAYEKGLNRNIGFGVAAFGAVALGSWLFPPSLIISVPASFLLTLPIYYKAYDSVRRQRKINYHVLSVINVAGIWLGGFFIPATLGALVYFLAEKLLMITQDRSYKGLANIFGQQPKSVWVVVKGIETEIPFEQVQAGDVVAIHAGQMIPVDGVILQGLASVDQHMLTGEAQPVEKKPGDTVMASTVLLAGQIQVQVEKAGQETVAAQIGHVLNRTASYQMSLQSKGSAIAHGTAPYMLALGAVAWPLIGLEQGLAILNSGFGLNIRITAPIAMLNFLNIASRQGILVKDGRSLELLSEVDTVVFDKTGTLTLEQPTVAQVHVCNDLDSQTLLRFAAAAEKRQPHPIARAILDAAAAAGIQPPAIDDARYEVGYGIKVWLEGHQIRVGSDRFMQMEGISIPPEIMGHQEACHALGHSLIMVAVDDVLGGAIELKPTLRPEARRVIDGLHQRGLTLTIISGDQEEPTRRLAQELGIDQYFANTLPENKANLVEQLQKEGRKVCFVGDGINDSIALKKANVSISIRGATTVATDTAQIVLMDQSLNQLTTLFELAAEFDRNLKTGFASAIVPGLINISGIFLFGWGIYTAMFIYYASLLTNLGIAVWPTLHHRAELEAGLDQEEDQPSQA